MIVSVWKTIGTNGIDPLTVALSSLDRRILGLVGVIDDVHENDARHPSREKNKMNSAGAATSIHG